MKKISFPLFFIFIVLCCVSFFPIPALADQIVLDKYGAPLVLGEQEIILKNDKTGTISWEEFKQSYQMRGVNGVWHIIELEEKYDPGEYAPKEIDYEELRRSFQKDEIDYEPKEIDYEELQISFQPSEKELEAEKQFLDDEEEFEMALDPMTIEDYEEYMILFSSPLVLYLVAGLIIIICVGAWTGVEIASLSLIIYLVLGVIIDIIPIWVLIVIVLGSAGIIALRLAKGIGGGNGGE